jgi:hypothetical protein
MQAEGNVVRLPERSAEEPLDFTTFFAEEHRTLVKALLRRLARHDPDHRAP